MKRLRLSLLFLGVVAGLALEGRAASPPKLSLSPPENSAPARISAAAGTADWLVVEFSPDLVSWNELWRTQGSVESVADFTAPAGEPRFYRAFSRTKSATDDWKSLVHGDPGEPFLSEEPPVWQPAVRWIKFAFLVREPGRVYFQDSAKYDFHHDFARVRLPQFKGLSRAQFDAVSLRTNAQEVVLGAVLVPPSPNIRELGIQFVGLDAYPPDRIATWFRNVRAAIQVPAGTDVLYLPTFEQAETARTHSEWLAGRGVRVSSAGRWTVSDECYAPGWALGRLVHVPGAQILAAFRDGRLRTDDVLLTDAVPAEVPPLAGIIAFSPATPNSHVALLCRSFGIPFVHVSESADQAALLTVTNRQVMIRAAERFAGCEVAIRPLATDLPAADLDALAELKRPPTLNLPAKQPRGAWWVGVENLKPADNRFVGGKAANFGILRRKLPSNSPSPAIAITFDLWDAYLDQALPSGGTLRQAIQTRLAGFAWPPNVAAIQTALAEIREWITDVADFSPAQRAEILRTLQDAGFKPTENIRFRSSTNVEDGDQFSGAGLYDSFSGCLADELDADAAGPSACDPSEPKERGVFRALRKVYAGFYNDNAVLERLRHRVDETKVGMAVLVHPSSPDEIELANGVATLRVNRSDTRYVSGTLVSQPGAVSVTNPDSTAVPESVTVSQFGATPFADVTRRSSLVPLGGTVLNWDSDYLALFRLLNLAAQGYEAEFPTRKEFDLDLEYKKVNPGQRLWVKQIREVPQPGNKPLTPWLLDAESPLAVFQGEHGDVISKHRLKSEWRIALRSGPLTPAALAVSPVRFLHAEGRVGPVPLIFEGAPESLPHRSYQRPEASAFAESWTHGDAANQRKYHLTVRTGRATGTLEGPLLTLADQSIELQVSYASPQPALIYDPAQDRVHGATTTNESVLLGIVPPVSASSHRQLRVIKLPRGITIETEFWWPPEPKGIVAGYTAPLQAWIETRITGLTSRPLVVTGPWSQTYQPGHHNFYEEFAFEPRLDPAVPADLLAELAAKNIRAIIVGAGRDDFLPPTAFLWGLDEQIRPW